MVDFARMMFRGLPAHHELLALELCGDVVVSVSGSREGPTPEQRRALSTLIRIFGASAVVHGDCEGVDVVAHLMAMQLGLRSFAYPGDIERWRVDTGAERCCEPMSPTSRNRLIVQAGHVLVAVPRAWSSGTWDAVEWAVTYGRPCIVLNERGRPMQRERWQVRTL